jgi:hypothetical protein
MKQLKHMKLGGISASEESHSIGPGFESLCAYKNESADSFFVYLLNTLSKVVPEHKLCLSTKRSQGIL